MATSCMWRWRCLDGGLARSAAAAELKAIHTQKTKDAVVTLRARRASGSRARTTSSLEITSPDGQAARRRQGEPQHQHGDAGHGAHAGRRHADAGQDARGATWAPSASPTRRAAGDGVLGRAGGEGLGALLRAGAVGGASCGDACAAPLLCSSWWRWRRRGRGAGGADRERSDGGRPGRARPHGTPRAAGGAGRGGGGARRGCQQAGLRPNPMLDLAGQKASPGPTTTSGGRDGSARPERPEGGPGGGGRAGDRDEGRPARRPGAPAPGRDADQGRRGGWRRGGTSPSPRSC